MGARTAKGNLVGKYVALYNNVGAVLKNAGKPMTSWELVNHPAIMQVLPTKQKIQDVVIWYRDHGFITRRSRDTTPDDQSQYTYEWKGDRPNPDHSVYKVRRKRVMKKVRKQWTRRVPVMHVPAPALPQAMPQANGSISAADYIHQHDLEYLEGMVVVCITNWREKGMPMLLDAQAYLNKLVELEVEKK